jgi:hypothetical protein
MKHGHKAKEKSAKALQKPRTEKVRKESRPKSLKAGEATPGPAKAGGKGKGAAGVAAQSSSASLQLRADAETRKRAANGTPGFANPAVGNAFRRAVKKYSVALKRLTD